jgi:excinuclease ABC subunit C
VESQALIKKIKELPDSPGVYFFKKRNEILYIGKATSLKDRVKSYFSRDLLETRGPLIEKMVLEADDIEYETMESVLEALICEANYIKKFHPPYNSRDKDNKDSNRARWVKVYIWSVSSWSTIARST